MFLWWWRRTQYKYECFIKKIFSPGIWSCFLIRYSMYSILGICRFELVFAYQILHIYCVIFYNFNAFNLKEWLNVPYVEIRNDFNQQLKRGVKTHYRVYIKLSFCIPTIGRFRKIPNPLIRGHRRISHLLWLKWLSGWGTRLEV